MRASMSLFKTIQPIPLNSIPIGLLRLPSKPTIKPNTKKSNLSSPTIDKLINNLKKNQQNKPKRQFKFIENGSSDSKLEDGRGLGNAIDREGNVSINLIQEGEEESLEESEEEPELVLPPNLRIEQFIPKRIEYSGVKAEHRELLKKLRREA